MQNSYFVSSSQNYDIWYLHTVSDLHYITYNKMYVSWTHKRLYKFIAVPYVHCSVYLNWSSRLHLNHYLCVATVFDSPWPLRTNLKWQYWSPNHKSDWRFFGNGRCLRKTSQGNICKRLGHNNLRSGDWKAGGGGVCLLPGCWWLCTESAGNNASHLEPALSFPELRKWVLSYCSQPQKYDYICG